MGRPIEREPNASDFLSAEEYENSAPASFGLPELPILYLHAPLSAAADIWITSDCVIIWRKSYGIVYDLDSVKVEANNLLCPENASYYIESDDTASRIRAALHNCLKLFGNDGRADSVELAIPLDYESGDADDLGDASLIQSIGEGNTLKEGPIMAQKRRRSS